MSKEMDFIDSLFADNRSYSQMKKEAYDRYNQTPENMSNWLPKIAQTTTLKDTILKIPDTIIIPLDFEHFEALIDEKNKEENIKKLNSYLKNKIGSFNKDGELFMKTGIFSNKFNFSTCYCGNERDNLGEKLHEIYYMSMMYGANETAEVVIRKYIPSKEIRNEIYSGMPLHTEFRVFYDFDKHEIVGVSNYWHPESMTERNLKDDYKNYKGSKDAIMLEYESLKSSVSKEVHHMMKGVNGMIGKWSIDVMKNDEDFWLIDMARMERSALTEYIDIVN